MNFGTRYPQALFQVLRPLYSYTIGVLIIRTGFGGILSYLGRALGHFTFSLIGLKRIY